MADNARLAALILGQVSGQTNDGDAEIDVLLRDALRSSQSRLDLRDRLFEGARATNAFTTDDVAEAISETLSDLIRDLDDTIETTEQNAMPSRFVISTSIAAMVGALTAFVYGVADFSTATGAFGLAAGLFFATQTFRKRLSAHISRLKKRRADYDGFRSLLRRSA